MANISNQLQLWVLYRPYACIGLMPVLDRNARRCKRALGSAIAAENSTEEMQSSA